MDKEFILQKLNSLNKNTLAETLEMKFVDVGDDFLTMEMPVSSRVHQPYGILHGGATAALAENVGSAASSYFLNDATKVVKGIDLSINHLKSKSKGKIFAKAMIIHKGRTTHLWQIRVTDEEGKLISFAKLTNIVLDKKQTKG